MVVQDLGTKNHRFCLVNVSMSLRYASAWSATEIIHHKKGHMWRKAIPSRRTWKPWGVPGLMGRGELEGRNQVVFDKRCWDPFQYDVNDVIQLNTWNISIVEIHSYNSASFVWISSLVFSPRFLKRLLLANHRNNDVWGYVHTMKAHGGGDGPEAVTAALFEALSLPWRPNATKICGLAGWHLFSKVGETTPLKGVKHAQFKHFIGAMTPGGPFCMIWYDIHVVMFRKVGMILCTGKQQVIEFFECARIKTSGAHRLS